MRIFFITIISFILLTITYQSVIAECDPIACYFYCKAIHKTGVCKVIGTSVECDCEPEGVKEMDSEPEEVDSSPLFHNMMQFPTL